MQRDSYRGEITSKTTTVFVFFSYCFFHFYHIFIIFQFLQAFNIVVWMQPGVHKEWTHWFQYYLNPFFYNFMQNIQAVCFNKDKISILVTYLIFFYNTMEREKQSHRTLPLCRQNEFFPLHLLWIVHPNIFYLDNYWVWENVKVFQIRWLKWLKISSENWINIISVLTKYYIAILPSRSVILIVTINFINLELHNTSF